MDTEVTARESRRFFWLTQVFVVLLAGLQLSLCLQSEWGGGFSLSNIASVQFFNLHPLLNILAFGVAATESLISFKALGLRHAAAKTVHACLQLASFLLGVAAFTVVVLFHNSNKFPNFYSYSGALAAISSGLMQKQSFLRNNSPKAPLFGTANILANALGVTAVLTFFAVLAVLGFESVSSSHSPSSEGASGMMSPQDGDRAVGSTTDTERLRPRTPNRRTR